MDNLNTFFDHTLLKVTSTKSDYIKLCEEANNYGFQSVCVPPSTVSLAKTALQGTKVKICSVVGFPSGLNSTETKVYETALNLKNGADEIDMVANISFIKGQKWGDLYNEIKLIKNVCGNSILKVIVESSLLSMDEILNCCLVIKDANADFIKTSTGFNGPGAELNHVKYMKSILSESNVEIKASGGIRDLNTTLKFISAGANRIGSSSGVQIINQLQSGSTYEASSRTNY